MRKLTFWKKDWIMYAPIENKINETELRNDFNEFYRGIRLKWYFRNDVTPNFYEVPAFPT